MRLIIAVEADNNVQPLKIPIKSMQFLIKRHFHETDI